MAKVQEDGAVKEIHRTNKRQEAKPLYHEHVAWDFKEDIHVS